MKEAGVSDVLVLATEHPASTENDEQRLTLSASDGESDIFNNNEYRHRRGREELLFAGQKWREDHA